MHVDGVVISFVVTSLKQHVHTRTDVDECATNKDNCDANAVCTDTKDGFTCECKTGFTGDGTTCAPPSSVELTTTAPADGKQKSKTEDTTDNSGTIIPAIVVPVLIILIAVGVVLGIIYYRKSKNATEKIQQTPGDVEMGNTTDKASAATVPTKTAVTESTETKPAPAPAPAQAPAPAPAPAGPATRAAPSTQASEPVPAAVPPASAESDTYSSDDGAKKKRKKKKSSRVGRKKKPSENESSGPGSEESAGNSMSV